MTIMEEGTGVEEQKLSEISTLEEENGEEKEEEEYSKMEIEQPNISPEGKIFMKRALETQQILNQILTQLTFTDLLECRGVNHRWQNAASKILLARNSTQVSIEFYWQEDDINSKGPCLLLPFQALPPQQWKICFIGKHGLVRTVNQYMGQRVKSDYPYEMEKFSLASLTETLHNDKRHLFPATTFNLWDADLNHPDVKQFFKVQGQHIQTLRLISANPESPFTKVQIQKNKNNNNSKNGQDKFELPALKYLAWTDWDKNSVLRVLKAAPNLKISSLPNDNVECLEEILRAKNVDTVKRLRVSTINIANGYSQNIKKFAKTAPALRTLEFEGHRHGSGMDLKGPELKFRNKLKASCIDLLESCGQNLEILNLDDLCPKFELQGLPKFTRLTKLCLRVRTTGHQGSLLPSGIDLKTTFPMLETLELKMEELDEEDPEEMRRVKWDSHFHEGVKGSLETVERLEIDAGLCRDDWLVNIQEKLCPNFTTVHLKNCSQENLGKCLPKIFEIWTHLRVLKLHFAIGEDMPSLDESLICVPNGVCNGAEPTEEELREKSQRRKRPSVCDLKELKTIEIWTGRPYFDDDLPLSQSSLSSISNLMPNLKIGVYVRKNSGADQSNFLFD